MRLVNFAATATLLQHLIRLKLGLIATLFPCFVLAQQLKFFFRHFLFCVQFFTSLVDGVATL
jgi:hypothetical protein